MSFVRDVVDARVIVACFSCCLIETKAQICLYPSARQSSQGGGHRTLLYGHAILLRHNHSGMVRLSCRLFKEEWNRHVLRETFVPST